ncbi:MMPL family transporter [bacterium]|nr:MMPL family transporter [bacterium]
MYNNTLQSLFSSQIKTLYIIFFSFLLLFLILFKNILIATIALTVNIISIAFLFGLIGNLNIPLDIMTITIAAISIGISVDDTIHFIYRFQKEKIIHGKKKALEICQKTITYPMLFTSIIISVGFSALYLSNFIPNALFGLLISISMIVALLLNLILLPTTLSLLKEDIK